MNTFVLYKKIIKAHTWQCGSYVYEKNNQLPFFFNLKKKSGGFQVEMYRDSQRDRTILCRYDPTETGLYVVSVRWSGVDVPGSPFQINIVDTQQELEQVLHESSFAQSSITHRSYSQWRDDI